MKDVALYLGIFIVGYALTMGLLYFMFRIFFPFAEEMKVTKSPKGTARRVVKATRSVRPYKLNVRTAKMRIANG